MSTIRIDLLGHDVGSLEEYIKAFLDKNDQDLERYIISFEESAVKGKMHYQGIMIHKCTHEAIRGRVNRYFEEWKKGSKSCSPVKKLGDYLVYICKQKNIVFSKGYTDEEIEEFKSQSYLVKESPIKKKKKFLQVIVDALKEKNNWWTDARYLPSGEIVRLPNRRNIIHEILDQLGGSCMVFDKHIVLKLYMGVVNQLFDERIKWREMLVDSLEDHIKHHFDLPIKQ